MNAISNSSTLYPFPREGRKKYIKKEGREGFPFSWFKNKHKKILTIVTPMLKSTSLFIKLLLFNPIIWGVASYNKLYIPIPVEGLYYYYNTSIVKMSRYGQKYFYNS